MARFALAGLIAISVGIGAYFGSAQVARSAKAPPLTIPMRIGDVATVGRVQCYAVSDSRSRPIDYAYVRCGKTPLRRATYWVDVFPDSIGVWKKDENEPVYTTPR